MTVTDIANAIMQTEASGAPVRLEYVRGRFKVEASPASRHQMAVDRIRASLLASRTASPGCGCFSLADVLIRFPDPDESLKRPDIAIFCEQPPESDEALDLLPAAVVEIISLGYEEKDLGEDGAPFYLDCGIANVVVFDPRSKLVRHYTNESIETMRSPTVISLQCGCSLEV